MANQAKLIRGQLRQIVAELLPSLLTEALKNELHKQMALEVQKRLDGVVKEVKGTLDTIDQRSKDVQSYLVRQTTQVTKPAEVSEEPKTE